MHTGSCLCGAVAFEVAGALPPPDACHCSMCRRVSGHFWASTDVLRERVTITGAENVAWYASSEKVRRGFCRRCGCSIRATRFTPRLRRPAAGRSVWGATPFRPGFPRLKS